MEILLTFLQLFTLIFGFAYSAKRIKKYTSITWEVRRGMKCYSCGTDVDNDFDDAILKFEEKNDTKIMKLCVACKRDENLNQFIKSGFLDTTRLNKLKKYLFSKKSERLAWYLLFVIVLGIGIEIITRFFFDIKIFWILTPVINIIYWTIFCYKSKITHIKEKLIFKEE
jgi:hypothetical protein